MTERVSALRISRSERKILAASIASRSSPAGGIRRGPLELVEMDLPAAPSAEWVDLRPRLSGICGSDLATVQGTASDYFEPWVSFPFVPGHEVVADGPNGRVALQPELGHNCRGLPAPEAPDYRAMVSGSLSAGIQTGFCADAPGGWSDAMRAHPSQLHPVPDSLDDAAAVMVEPTACALHAVLRAKVRPDDDVVVIGAGTMGLAAIAALRQFTSAGRIVCVAKYPHQEAAARRLGADVVAAPSETQRAVRRLVGGHHVGPDLSSGAPVVIDAVGSAASIRQALGVCRPQGRVVLLGMPGVTGLDLTALWHREIELVGAYTYGDEVLDSGRSAHTFELAFELVAAASLGDLVSAAYPLRRWREALEHAATAGRRGAHKVVFELN